MFSLIYSRSLFLFNTPISLIAFCRVTVGQDASGIGGGSAFYPINLRASDGNKRLGQSQGLSLCLWLPRCRLRPAASFLDELMGALLRHCASVLHNPIKFGFCCVKHFFLQVRCRSLSKTACVLLEEEREGKKWACDCGFSGTERLPGARHHGQKFCCLLREKAVISSLLVNTALFGKDRRWLA